MSIVIKGKVYRNLQEQVEENMLEIEKLKKYKGIYGPYESLESIPEDDLEKNYVYLIGATAPYDAYLYTSEETFTPLGQYPVPGPEGPRGPQGAPGRNGTNGTNGQDGADGVTPHIGGNGNWFIGDVDTNVHAQGPAGADGTDGTDGITPHIGANGNWFIGDVDTEVHAQGPAGENGTDGTDGADGITPHIGANGNWFIGETDTNVHAQGPAGADGADGTDGTNGVTPHIDSTTGNWFIGDVDTGVHAQGPQGVGAYTAGTGIDITGDVVSIKPDNRFTKSGINEITAGSVNVKTQNYDTYDGTQNLAGQTIMDSTTYLQTMLKPNHNTIAFFSAEQFMQTSVNKGEDAPDYTMTFADANNTGVYTFKRNKSGDVAVTSEIPDTSNMVTTDTDQSIYAGKYLRSNNSSGYGRISYSGLSYTSNSETSNMSASAATFRNSNNTTGYSTGYGMEKISHRYKTGTSSLNKPFEISFTNETTNEVEGKYTFDNTKTGTVAVTSEIPTVSGTNDGTNWTSITLGSDTYAIPSGGSAPSNMVTTDTDQEIVATKTFTTAASDTDHIIKVYPKTATYGPEVVVHNKDAYNNVSETKVRSDNIRIGAISENNYTKLENTSSTTSKIIVGTDKTSFKIDGFETSGGFPPVETQTTFYNFPLTKKGDVAITSEIITSYNDLTDKPTIPAAQVNADWNAASGVAQILNKPNLATVATSGSYTDLTDKPSIPSTASSTSTSTVTPTTVQLTFTYSDNTTETVTLMTGATVSTTTTTTLS